MYLPFKGIQDMFTYHLFESSNCLGSLFVTFANTLVAFLVPSGHISVIIPSAKFYMIFYMHLKNLYICPRRVLAQTAKARGGTLEAPRIYGEENFAVPEKNFFWYSDFWKHGSQRITQKYAKDCRKFAGGWISMQRILGAECPPRGCCVSLIRLLRSRR